MTVTFFKKSMHHLFSFILGVNEYFSWLEVREKILSPSLRLKNRANLQIFFCFKIYFQGDSAGFISKGFGFGIGRVFRYLC